MSHSCFSCCLAQNQVRRSNTSKWQGPLIDIQLFLKLPQLFDCEVMVGQAMFWRVKIAMRLSILSNVPWHGATACVSMSSPDYHFQSMSVNTGDDMEHMEQIRHHNFPINPRNTCKTAMNQLKYVWNCMKQLKK